MATLENVDGRSLLADNTNIVNSLLETFQEGKKRKQIGDVLGKDSALNEQNRDETLIRLMTLDPQLGQNIQGVLKGRDARKISQANKEALQGARDAQLVLGQKDLVGMRKALNQIASQRVANNKPLGNIPELMNLGEDELRLRMQQQELKAADASAVIKNAVRRKTAPQFVTEFKNGVPVQKNILTGEEIESPRADTTKFQSKIGKLIGDQKTIRQAFGAESPQAAAINELIESEQKGEKPKQTDIAGQRKEFTKLSGEVITMANAVRKINATPDDASGDLALVFSFMKILDPGSTVREGEFANASNAAGVPERVRNLWNKVQTGEFLTPTQRRQFRNTALKTFESQIPQHEKNEKKFTEIAKRANFNPEDVVIDFLGDLRPKKGGKGDDDAGTSTQMKVGESKTVNGITIRRKK